MLLVNIKDMVEHHEENFLTGVWKFAPNALIRLLGNFLNIHHFQYVKGNLQIGKLDVRVS